MLILSIAKIYYLLLKQLLFYNFFTSAEREVKVSRRLGMYQSYNFLTRLGMQSL